MPRTTGTKRLFRVEERRVARARLCNKARRGSSRLAQLRRRSVPGRQPAPPRPAPRPPVPAQRERPGSLFGSHSRVPGLRGHFPRTGRPRPSPGRRGSAGLPVELSASGEVGSEAAGARRPAKRGLVKFLLMQLNIYVKHPGWLGKAKSVSRATSSHRSTRNRFICPLIHPVGLPKSACF